MKGFVFSGPGKGEVRTLPDKIPGPGEVLVKVAFCGICGTDFHKYEGKAGSRPVKYPVPLGHEVSGIVEAVGEDVRSVRPGDRVVVSWGTHSRFQLMDERNVHLLEPENTLTNNGKPFIIDFFATWCKPCNRELTAISEVYDEWQEETGVKVIAVSIDQAQNINKVKPLVDNHGWPYEVLLDPNSDFKRALGIQMIPYVLIVDGKGNIVYKHNGYTEGAEQELIDKVRELVK